MNVNTDRIEGMLLGMRIAASIVQRKSPAGQGSSFAQEIMKRAMNDELILEKWKRDRVIL